MIGSSYCLIVFIKKLGNYLKSWAKCETRSGVVVDRLTIKTQSKYMVDGKVTAGHHPGDLMLCRTAIQLGNL